MKKAFFAAFLAIFLFISSSTTYAAQNQIKVDGVTITSDVKPEMKNKRAMVPLRVIYYKNAQYDFLGQKGKSLARFDIYSLISPVPSELSTEYPEILIHDVSKDEWYLFNDTARKSINQLMDTA
ncbi:hypothetical protein G9G54_01950 [Paenibacillus sp. EKM212P]|uniref:stalk domain-containing protein n=1 Tax=Paenibacillus sp. EKM212P TaxID=1683680 RepID=UPI0013EAF632|nr:hypothetical protein [Paenibacillus sp. EKM212P]KAF6581117.1 hypothetical protein G9G54_01950 [Paenibacillus sp. EKM212P]